MADWVYAVQVCDATGASGWFAACYKKLYSAFFLKRIFFADSLRITCIGMATPIAKDMMMNNVLAPLFTVSEMMVEYSGPILPVSLIKPSMVRYAKTPGINGITEGIAKIIGGTCLKCAMGMLKIPTADAPTKDANTTPTVNCSKVNFNNPPMAPPTQSANNVLGGTLNNMPKPTAPHPHQKALPSTSSISIINYFRL